MYCMVNKQLKAIYCGFPLLQVDYDYNWKWKKKNSAHMMEDVVETHNFLGLFLP